MTKLKLNNEKMLSSTIQDKTIQTETSLTNWISNLYVNAATSDNTRKAYRSDIKHFEKWGGLLPTTPEVLIHYFQFFAEKLNSRTLSRRLVAIKQWHLYQGFADPTAHPLVIKTLTGINRIHGKPKQKALPLSPDDILKIIKSLQLNSTLRNIRDMAIIQIGYFGALRRSEIVNIHHEHINWQKEGIEILLPSSKTDQLHAGQYCAIPYGNEILCPVQALKNWLEISNIQQGAVFKGILRNNSLSAQSLTPLSINHIIKRCAKQANIPDLKKISPHSLRRGLATNAAYANASIKTIMRAGRWKAVNTVMEYIEARERFEDSAAASVLLKMNSD